jgi:hypothetical protein
MDRASFYLLFRPETLVVVSRPAASIAPVARTYGTPNNMIARHVPPVLSKIGHRGCDILCGLFPRLYTGQDCAGEISYRIPVINRVIPIALVAAGLCVFVRRLLRQVRHVFNHMIGVTQRVGNIDQNTGKSLRESGNLTQIGVGRTSHV